ncbi:MAG: DUF2141 domain-containing protein [Desulfobacterales bacterium]|nr:DUF2141 domain-containing protein [Desulfobacterales bacterium]
MKNYGISLLLTSICFFVLLVNSAQAGDSHGSLFVAIEGFANSKGYAMIAVYDSEQAYKEGSPKTAMAKVEVTDQKAEVIFNDLKYGTYAVAIFHDQNANGKMDTNFLGIPNESYGHSNNVRGAFGPPSFDKAKIELGSMEKQIKIKLGK